MVRTASIEACVAVVLTAAVMTCPRLARAQEVPGQAGGALPDRWGTERSTAESLLPPEGPWARLGLGVDDDDQPMTGYSAGIEGGTWLLPWLSADVVAGWTGLQADPRSERVVSAEVATGARWDRLNLEAEVWGGGFRRSEAGIGDWSGGAAARYAGPAGAVVEARTERSAYVWTRRSLGDSLAVVSLQGALARPSGSGWAGRLSYREIRLPDRNRIADVRAWILAPVARIARGGLRMGYAFHTADSDESSFAPSEPLEWDEEGRAAGGYRGAYTPEEIVSHSILGEVRYDGSERFRVRLDGSWGFEAKEEQPVLVRAVPGVPESGIDLQFQRRSFVPWDVAARAETVLRPGWELQIGGGYEVSAFRSGSFVRAAWVIASGG